MSVSEFKDEVADIVETELEETVESVSKDQMGNVYGIKRGSSRMGPWSMVREGLRGVPEIVLPD
jgi:putative aminopeptidase FrvX